MVFQQLRREGEDHLLTEDLYAFVGADDATMRATVKRVFDPNDVARISENVRS